MSSWRLPTPHEVLFGIVLIATVFTGAHVFKPGSAGDIMVQLVMGVGGLLGIRIAALYLPPHVKEVLAVHDDQVKTALAAAPPATPVQS